jgi:hypothetical protein
MHGHAAQPLKIMGWGWHEILLSTVETMSILEKRVSFSGKNLE